MKAAFYTLGCRVNQYESHAMSHILRQGGYDIVPLSAAPDVIIVNSCTVTGESDRKTRQHVRSLRRQNPSAVIVLTGCMPQAFPDKAESLTEADIVLGNTDNRALCGVIDEFLSSGRRIVRINQHPAGERYVPVSAGVFGEKTRAYIKIEDGCSRFCTYCIIPTARGRVRSRSLDEIKYEAQALSDAGYTDITLVGINLTAFGSDTGYDICDAVEAVSAPEGISRIRLGSIEPDDFTVDVAERLSGNPKFCHHFHLALQSGCDRTLRRMNRRYDSGFYCRLCEDLRGRFDDCAITADIMVGFPGESDEDFEQSLNFVRSIGFSDAHVFAYSRREGTPAAAMSEQVSSAVKSERSRRMAEAVAESRRIFLEERVGREYEVLCESRSAQGYFSGRTKNYLEVRFCSEENIAGRTVTVRTSGVRDGRLCGDII